MQTRPCRLVRPGRGGTVGVDAPKTAAVVMPDTQRYRYPRQRAEKPFGNEGGVAVSLVLVGTIVGICFAPPMSLFALLKPSFFGPNAKSLDPN